MLSALTLLALGSTPAHATLGVTLRADCGDGWEEVSSPDVSAVRKEYSLTVIHTDGDDVTRVTVKTPVSLAPLGVLVDPSLFDLDETCTVLAGLGEAEHVAANYDYAGIEKLETELYDFDKAKVDRVSASFTMLRDGIEHQGSLMSVDPVDEDGIVITDTSSGIVIMDTSAGFWGANGAISAAELAIVITDTSAG